ncbi:MAG TPA: DUF1223 domain-containing protein [Alphaproteobacteria bacterium]|nr:DUF1223 domain-containing protein [Alphaproteobacteria bacterium]
MRQSSVWLAVFFLLGVALVPRVLSSRAPAKPAARKAVVVELFTSEGCSSCPPADRLLASLEQERSTNGAEIIPLGFHVDYWDFQGWRDRFDSPAYTSRQEQYAERFHIQGPYTPQMVIDGEEEFVGSSSSHARSAIASAAASPQLAEIEISAPKPDSLAVKVTAPGPSTAQVLFAITEDNLESKVAAGENGGHVLRHAAVVRDLRVLGRLDRGSLQVSVPLKLDASWKKQDLRYVVFVQDGTLGKIGGAASLTAASGAGLH